jgi:predicted transglutaminase-like protease
MSSAVKFDANKPCTPFLAHFLPEKFVQGIRENMVLYHRSQDKFKWYSTPWQIRVQHQHFQIIQTDFVISSTNEISETLTPLNFFSYL